MNITNVLKDHGIGTGGYKNGEYVKNITFQTENIRIGDTYAVSDFALYNSTIVTISKDYISSYNLTTNTKNWQRYASADTVTIDNNGNIFYNNGSTLKKMDKTGLEIWSADMSYRANAICASTKGYIYVGEYRSGSKVRVHKYNANTGAYISQVISDTYELNNQINSIIEGSDGYIYITSTGATLKVNSSDTIIWNINTGFYRIFQSKIDGNILGSYYGLSTINKDNGSVNKFIDNKGGTFCEDNNGDYYGIVEHNLIKYERKSQLIVWELIDEYALSLCYFHQGKIYYNNHQNNVGKVYSLVRKIKLLN